jgi:putative ABC transport system substrate-binding protein
MRRREVIAGIGSVAAAWPLASRAQQPAGGGVRRVGILTPNSERDLEAKAWRDVFAKRLQELGWKDGENVRLIYRFAEGDAARMSPLAKELLDAEPDVILTTGANGPLAIRQFTLTTPVVFTQVADPVALGIVTDLARPKGNVTGFTNFEFSIGGKWLEILKTCAPGAIRVLLIFDPANPAWTTYLRAIEAAAPSFAIELTPAGVQSDADLDRSLAAFAKQPNGAILVLPAASTVSLLRRQIISRAAQLHLPAVYPYSAFAKEGGLVAYGPHISDGYRRAAEYVDRIFKGAKVADLPVQNPTKYELVINLKTAGALGLSIPSALRATADEVIE